MVVNLSACWGSRELKSLAVVLGTGLDTGAGPGSVKLTAQVVKAGDIKASTSGALSEGMKPEKKAYANISDTDASVPAAFSGISHLINKVLYFPHNKILIFGSELAKLGVGAGLDTFMRDIESRMNVYIMIARGSASDILDEEPELEKIPAIHISDMIEHQRVNSETPIVTLRDFAIATLSGSMAPVAPIIELREDDGKKTAALEGTAVFKQGRMIGELDKAQSRGFLFVTGKADGGELTLDTQWGKVAVELDQVKSTLKPEKSEDGTIRMKLTIKGLGHIDSNETYVEMTSPDKVEELKGLTAEKIRADVENALNKAKSFPADVFGFGDVIRGNYPENWEKLKENWDAEFRKIELDTGVEIELHSAAGLIKPVKPGGAA